MGCKKGTKKRRWSKEEKLMFIQMHLNEHKSVCEIEREYVVNNSLISARTKKYL